MVETVEPSCRCYPHAQQAVTVFPISLSRLHVDLTDKGGPRYGRPRPVPSPHWPKVGADHGCLGHGPFCGPFCMKIDQIGFQLHMTPPGALSLEPAGGSTPIPSLWASTSNSVITVCPSWQILDLPLQIYRDGQPSWFTMKQKRFAPLKWILRFHVQVYHNPSCANGLITQ